MGAKVTDSIADKIRELDVAGVTQAKIVVVIQRDFGVKISAGHICKIINGYKAEDKGSFTEKDKEYIDNLIDGKVFETEVNIDRLTKFGFVEVYYREGISMACKHFNATVKENYFTTEKAEEILEEVENWIDKKDVRGEDEKWFEEMIQKRRKEK